MGLSIIDAFSGIMSISSRIITAAARMGFPAHVAGFYESDPTLIRFAQLHSPHAESLGSIHSTSKIPSTAPSLFTVSHDCALYTSAGPQRMQWDHRSHQVPDVIKIISHLQPLYVLLEQVESFFDLDNVHGHWSMFQAALRSYHIYPILRLHDALAGGSLARKRGFCLIRAAIFIQRLTKLSVHEFHCTTAGQAGGR